MKEHFREFRPVRVGRETHLSTSELPTCREKELAARVILGSCFIINTIIL